jgi:hypothetical protein
MSRFNPGPKGHQWKRAAARDDEPNEEGELMAEYVPGLRGEAPAIPHPPVLAYVLERDGGGWRPSIYRVPASILVAHGELVHTHEPDLKGLALEQLVRHIEERTQ